MKTILLLSVLSIPAFMQMTAQGTDRTVDGARVTSGNTTAFYQAGDRPCITIVRDGNARIAQMTLDGESEVRHSMNLTAEQTMEIGFADYTVKGGAFSFYDQVQGKTTTRNEVDAAHGDNLAIHYERNFTNTGWSAWNVPFNVTYETATAAGLSLYRINLSTNEVTDGVGSELIKFYIHALKPGEKAFANKPYLVKASKTGVASLDLEDATLERTESVSIDCATTQVTYTFTTNPETVMSWDLSGCYVMNNGIFEFVTANPHDLCPWRWYMEPSVKDYVYYSKFRFVEADEDEATDISNVQSADATNSGRVYNLSGQRVSAPVKGNIYIINNKKVVY